MLAAAERIRLDIPDKVSPPPDAVKRGPSICRQET